MILPFKYWFIQIVAQFLSVVVFMIILSPLVYLFVKIVKKIDKWGDE